MPDADKVRLGTGVASLRRRALLLGSPANSASPPVSSPGSGYAVRARCLDNGASLSQSPARRAPRTKIAVPEAKAKPGHEARQVSGGSRPHGRISSSGIPITPRGQTVAKPSYAQAAFGKPLPGRRLLSRRSASDDEKEERLLIAASAAHSLPKPAFPGLNPEADPAEMQDVCQSGCAASGTAEVSAGSESGAAASAGVCAPEMSPRSSPTASPPVSPEPPDSPTCISEMGDSSAQQAERSRNCSYRSFIVGGASTDNTRSRGDDIAAAIAAARVAASRATTEHRNMSNDPTLDQGRASDLKRQRELYADCANLRWQLWAQDAAREDGLGASMPAGGDSLAPRVASFAAQLLWEHDRAVLEAERCNAWAAEARAEAEKAESRLEEAMAMQDNGKMDQASRHLGEGTWVTTSSVLDCVQQVEIECTDELAAALLRCERVETSFNECELGNALAFTSLRDTEDALQRERDAHSCVGFCMERMNAEMTSECEVAQTLRTELMLGGGNELTAALQHEKIESLSNEVARMTELSEKQLSELCELRTSAQSVPFSSQVERTVSDPLKGPVHLRQRISSPRRAQTQAEMVMSDQIRTAAFEALEQGPRGPSKKTHAALEQEVGGLLALVQQLAEELGNMHTAHSEVVTEKEEMFGEKTKFSSQLEEAKAVNDVLAEQVLKLRLSSGADPSPARERSGSSPARLKAGRHSPSAPGSKAHSQILAEALTRENRRLRVATLTAEAVGGLRSLAETPPGNSQR